MPLVAIVNEKGKTRRGDCEPVSGHESRPNGYLRRRLALVDMDIAYHFLLHSESRHSDMVE